MKKTLVAITLGIFLLSLASAMYSGECDKIQFPNTDSVNLTVTGNSSNMEGLTWNKNGTEITYCFDLDFAPDEFTLTFYNYQSVSVDSGSSSSSGSSGSSSRISLNTLTQGYTKHLLNNQKIFFKLQENHEVQFLGFEGELAKIKIQSEPIYVYLGVGDTKLIELENETISIKLLSKDSRGIDLFIQKVELQPIDKHDNDVSNNTDSIDIIIEPKNEDSNIKYILIGLGTILAIFLIISIYSKKRDNDFS